jgi:P63C domain
MGGVWATDELGGASTCHARPKWWGKLVIELIYDTLDPTVAKWLKENKPPLGFKWHQQLTENYGARKLVSRCYEIIGMAKTCHTIRELRHRKWLSTTAKSQCN